MYGLYIVKTILINLTFMPINPNNISLRQLRAFYEVARAQSFSSAAVTLCLTKSALSETIKQLELQIGARLLDRTTRKVQLSTIGEEFFEEVTQVLDRLGYALQRLEDISSVGSGLVRITGAPSVLQGIVMPSLARVRRQYPKIRAVLHEQGADGICQKILRGEVDFGVGALYDEDIDRLACTPLLTDRYVVIAPLGHPLLDPSVKQITINDLAGYAYIGLTADTLIGHVLSATTSAPPNVREPEVRVSNTSLLCGAIENGLGISILTSLSMRFLNAPKIGARLLSDPPIERSIQMFKRPQRSLSPAAKVLWDEIYREMRSLPESSGVSVVS